MIWLLSASHDYGDCCCVHCNIPAPSKASYAPEEQAAQAISQGLTQGSIPVPGHSPIPPPIQAPVEQSSARVEKSERPVKVTPVPLPPIPGQPSYRPPSITPHPQGGQQPLQSAQQKPIQQTPVPIPTPIQPREPIQSAQPTQVSQPTPSQPLPLAVTNPSTPVPVPAAAAPTPLQLQPAQQTLQQQTIQQQAAQQPKPQAIQWSLKGSFLFRAGELVWYQTGNTWRLGIIATPLTTPPMG